jgi:hypothetical protein
MPVIRPSSRHGAALLHGKIAGPAPARQDGAVGNERCQIELVESLPYGVVVLDGFDERERALLVAVLPQQTGAGDDGQLGAEQFGCLASENGPAGGGQPHLDAGLEPFLVQHDGGAIDHFLSACVDVDEPALTGTAPALDDAANRAADGSSEKTLCSQSSDASVEQLVGNARDGLRNADANSGRRGERIALDVIDEQLETVELVSSGDLLVGFVTPAIDPLKQLPQRVFIGHSLSSFPPGAVPRLMRAGRRRIERAVCRRAIM